MASKNSDQRKNLDSPAHPDALTPFQPYWDEMRDFFAGRLGNSAKQESIDDLMQTLKWRVLKYPPRADQKLRDPKGFLFKIADGDFLTLQCKRARR